MKKLAVFVLAIILAFGFFSCVNEDSTLSNSEEERLYLELSTNSSKPLPSTRLSVEIPKKAKKDEPIAVKIGMGKLPSTQYNNYIETFFNFDAQGIIVNGNNDNYSLTFDINEEKYWCDQYGKPQYFIEIPLDFSSCVQISGTVIVELTSYFPGLDCNQSDGTRFHVDYTIEDNYVRFSSN